MKRIFSFDGRIGRKEFASYHFGGLFICAFLAELSKSFPLAGLLFVIVGPAFAWLIFSQGVKRCHDLDNSGWFVLIPFYGLWLLFEQGDDGRNRFGPDPRW